MIGSDERQPSEEAESSQDSRDAREADRAHKAALKREERLERRLNESSTLFTRADVLVVIVSLVLAAAVSAMSWFGAGFDAGGTAETEASGDAGTVSVASSSDGAGSEDGVAQIAQSESHELDEGQGSAVQDQTYAGFSSDADSTGAGAGLYAVVQNTEGFYQVLPLWEDAEVRVESSFGYNVVEVSEGRVRVSEADCKNQICVNTGWSSSEGQIITCLPHQLVVEIVSDPADASSLG